MSSDKWMPAVSELHVGLHGLQLDDVGLDTRAVAGRLHMSEPPETPLVPPIYHTSTYKIPTVQRYLDIVDKGGYIYSRLSNPSCMAAEAAISALEGGAGTLVFSSGMGAISTCLMAFLKAGDHVVSCNPVYAGTHAFLQDYLVNFGIELTWVKTGSPVSEYKKAMKPNTKLVYTETPCNPLISITDLEEFGKLGSDGVVTMVDSTYAPPTTQLPIQYGIDIVMHSGTKYMGGHSDILAGVASFRTTQQWQQVSMWRTLIGAVLSPFEASLLLRGIKTLPLRMERHCANAQTLAHLLEAHPKVAKVYYPGLPSHEGHAIAKRQMTNGFGGMVSFEMKGGLEPARRLVEGVRLINLAVSLGGVESLIEHPATMTHGPMVMTDEDRKASLITDGHIRFSVGLESVEDLVNDLNQALDKA